MEIPKEVKFVVDKLKKKGFEAYLVGGCVRDLLREVEPEDWDVATNAKPKEIEKIFPKSFADNKDAARSSTESPKNRIFFLRTIIRDLR